MPRGISLWHPARSFCPSCARLIPWYENVPVVSYLLLGGRCSGCGAGIPLRYLVVEILTGGLFLWSWNVFHWPLAGAYWVLLGLLITATFIDLEHYIIPNEITWGGIVAGIILSAIVPEMMETTLWWDAVVCSLIGAGVGLGTLWCVVEVGKLLFGRKRVVLPKPACFALERGDDNRLSWRLEENVYAFDEIFARKSDELVVECEEVFIDGQQLEIRELRMRDDAVTIGDERRSFDQLRGLYGRAIALTIPREAMGLGDVKFLGAIGAFLGWQAVLFTVFTSSVLGSIIGLAILIKERGRSDSVLPFGPFLALGALLWILFGKEIWGRWF